MGGGGDSFDHVVANLIWINLVTVTGATGVGLDYLRSLGPETWCWYIRFAWIMLLERILRYFLDVQSRQANTLHMIFSRCPFPPSFRSF